jgi:hypothetical protein
VISTADRAALVKPNSKDLCVRYLRLEKGEQSVASVTPSGLKHVFHTNILFLVTIIVSISVIIVIII